MSKLSELIAKLCPDGVEYRKIKDTYKRLRGTPITANKMKEIANQEGEVRIFAGGKTVINAFEKDIPNANITVVPSVLVQSRGIIDFVFYEKPFTFKNEMWAYTADEIISVKFLYYVLKNNVEYFRNAASGMGSLPQISLSVTENYIIPVPPLEVQREIVRILDNFAETTEELAEKLNAELIARKKQYEYYRDLLLTFDDAQCPQGGGTHRRRENSAVRWMKLGDVATVTKLAGFEFTSYVRYSEHGKTIALRGLNIKNGHIILDDVKYIDDSNFTKLSRSKLYINDMLFTYVGTVGQVALINEDDKYYLAPNVALIRIMNVDIIPKFVMYFFLSKAFFHTQIQKLTQNSSMKNLTMEKIRRFQIPVPSLSEQRRVVAILDHFDALCHDVCEGLPAEIAARRKQYEYYRDKLLTFKEKTA